MLETKSTQKITLAGGCFWCLEAAFEQLKGVISVLPGYMGGHDPQPTYEAVCQGDSGHAEVVQIEFDPSMIDVETLLTAFSPFMIRPRSTGKVTTPGRSTARPSFFTMPVSRPWRRR